MRKVPATLQGRELVAGIQTIKFVSVTSKASTTTYVAPSLNCMVLKQEDEWKDASGAIVSRTVKEATAVVKGEPPASLFEIPAGYIKSKPSEMSMGLAQLYLKGECPECLRRANERADMTYGKNRPHVTE
jgi:hypothetical protein